MKLHHTLLPFVITFFMTSCSMFETHKYDGYWMVEAKNKGKSLPSLPIRQWKIEGTTILTTVDFSKDMAKIGFKEWPGEQLAMSFKSDKVIILSGRNKSLEFKMDFKDYGAMGFDIISLTLSNDRDNLTINLIRQRK